MPTTRHLTITTPIDSDSGELFVRSMHGRETLGQLFSYQLELISEKNDLKCENLVGKRMTVHLETVGETRHFNGVVAHFSFVGTYGRYAAYRAILRPWFWLMSLTRNNEVFQRMQVPDMARLIFRTNGFSEVEPTQLNGEYDKREYILQYQESTFDFISRWLEHEGVYYYFKHEDGSHKLCLADDSTAGKKVPQYEEIPYLAPTEAGRHENDHFDEWRETANVISDSYVVDAFDFQKPSAALHASADAPGGGRMAERWIYEAPAFYTVADAGTRYAKRRAEQLRTGEALFEGVGNVRGLAPGAVFKLTGHSRESLNRDYCVVAAEYMIHAEEFESSGRGVQHKVRTQIRAIDASTLFRPPRTSLWPVVGGLESATVVGDKDSEIHTDEYGRVRVQFHWDKAGPNNQDSSCFIRVAQPWAGAGFGTQFIPRVGEEVLVHFLSGDPDQPIVIGSAYNGEHKPPFAIEKHRTQTGIRTRSTKQGNVEQYNELCFDDEKGAEQLRLRAQRDMTTTVNHDSTISVGNDETHNVKGTLATTVATGDYKIEVNDGFMTVLIGKDNHSLEAKSIFETATEEIKMSLHAPPVEIAMDSKGIRLTVPNSSISIAPEGVELTCAGSSIKVTPAGIVINGMQISLNGSVG